MKNVNTRKPFIRETKMATYQDIHRVIKETIQVDANPAKRWTPQLVKFINHDNEFYGKFYGSINASEFFASNCSLSNVSISSCRLYDLSGNEIDLNAIFPAISAMNYRFDGISSMVYIELPNRIDKVHTYVDTVSSGISVLIDEKIEEIGRQGSKDLSAVSAFLQGEIEQEWKDRYDNDKALSDITNSIISQVSEISGKIKGGLVYRGMVIADDTKLSTFADLIGEVEKTKESDVVLNGYMYLVHNNGDTRIIEGKSLNNGDYLVVKFQGLEYSKKVSDITHKDIEILDAMDSKVYTLISQLSTNISTLSGTINGLNYDSNLKQDNSISIITRIFQTSGQLNIQSKELVSSDVKGLEDFVEKKINDIHTDSPIVIDHGVISSISQNNGIISVTKRALVSSDFNFSGGHNNLPISYVDGLEDRLSILYDTDWRTLKFNGHIKNSDVITNSNNLSDIFSHEIFDDVKIYNGSFIHIDFQDGQISAKLSVEDLYFYKGDYLIIHDHDNSNKIVEKSTIKYGINAFMIRSGNSYGDIQQMVSEVLLSSKKYTDEVSSYLNSKLNVSVDVVSSDEQDILSVYTIKQGGLSVESQIKIPKTTYTGENSDTISVYVQNYKICADIRNNSISSEHLYSELCGDIFFKNNGDIQNINNEVIFLSTLCADFANIKDNKGSRLSDIVDLENTFGSMYNGIINIISECDLKGIDFKLSYPISSAFDSINKIGADSKIDVPTSLDIHGSVVKDGFLALSNIIEKSKFTGNRTLDNELKKIDKRFDINEKSIGEHTREIKEMNDRIKELETRIEELENFINGINIVIK